MQSSDLFGYFQEEERLASAFPPEGAYVVRLGGVERLKSESRGTMLRLSAAIAAGQYAGHPAYKMLTDDYKGLEWVEKAVTKLKLWPQVSRETPRREALQKALDGQLARVSVYHYVTGGQRYLTIRNIVAAR